MLNVIKLTKEQFKSPEILKKVSEVVEEYTFHGRNWEAENLLLALQKKLDEFPDLKNTDPEVYGKYQDLIIDLKLEALDLMTNEEVIELFEKHILKILKPDISNFGGRLRNKLLSIPLLSREDYLKDLREALKRNEQKLGEQTIIINGERKSPLVRNWLTDYNNTLGAGKHTDIEMNDYIFHSPSAVNLKYDQIKLLRKLLALYEILKLGIRDLGSPATFWLYRPDIVGYIESKIGTPKVSRIPSKPAVIPPVAPSKPPAEIEKEIEAKRKAEEERIARLEREMNPPMVEPKVAPPPVEAPRPKPFAPSPKPEVAPPTEPVGPPKIKPAPSFPKPSGSVRPPRIEAARPIESFKPIKPIKSVEPIKISSIDDVKKLSVSDFRGYDEVPRNSARAITNKINSILASPLDRIKALSSWKESDLYELYIEMGRESMSQEKSVKELAEERRAEGKSFLSHEEFEAIAEISGAIG